MYNVSLFTIKLITIIAFSGVVARIFAELDSENFNEIKDYRKQLNQLSIYASQVLQNTMLEKQYTWVNFFIYQLNIL